MTPGRWIIAPVWYATLALLLLTVLRTGASSARR
jgi:hypothetical protein